MPTVQEDKSGWESLVASLKALLAGRVGGSIGSLTVTRNKLLCNTW